jgi:D-lactate dehydrogenase
MNIFIYSWKNFEQPYLAAANTAGYEIESTEAALSLQTASMANGFLAVCVFAGDDVSAPVLRELHRYGVRYIAIRAAGYDNVDLEKAAELGISVANVPAYSPYAIAEHAVALILALNRKLPLAAQQVQQHDFRVNKLVGFDLRGKMVGIIGTGKIGRIVAKILHGFGCRLLGYDIRESTELKNNYGLEYVDLSVLCRQSDIITIHTSLTSGTRYMINDSRIALMKKGVMLINTSRGACVNTQDLLQALEKGHIGYYGADVYENERGVFFYDWSKKELQDDHLQRLLALPDVLITPHQAFATREALTNIADTTFYNICCWEKGTRSKYELTPPRVEMVSPGKQFKTIK